MKQKIKLKLFECCLMVLIPLIQNAQLPPNDKNWELETTISDDFTNAADFDTRWENSYGGGDWCTGVDLDGNCYRIVSGSKYSLNFVYRRDEISHNSDILHIQARNDPTGIYDHSTGYCLSRNTGGFGYYEIRTKLAESYNHWPSFWLHGSRWVSGVNVAEIEIDIFELTPEWLYPYYNSGNPDYREFTTHFKYITFQETAKHHFVPNNEPGLNEDFHTFGCEVLPGKVNYYHNGRYIWVDPCNDLQGDIRLNIRSGQSVVYYYLTATIESIPDILEIDYINYWELIMDHVNEDVTLEEGLQIYYFDWGVRRNIILGKSSGSLSLAPNNNLTFRATNEISIVGDFTAPLGCELGLFITPSY
ncbi:hypothetical protein ACFLTE_11205 [Bacteroidota bacterium]